MEPWHFRLPKDKSYPPDAAQCDDCGGRGCATCGDRGWVVKGDPKGRKCERPGCRKFIKPHQEDVYCSNLCAQKDA